MVLFAGAGLAARWLFDAEILFPVGLLVGLLVAAAVPGKSCAIPKGPVEPKPKPTPTPTPKPD